MRVRFAGAIVVTVSCLGALGCSDGGPTKEAGPGHRARVSGTVLVHNKPASGGTLHVKALGGPEGAAAATATVQADGKFTVESVSGPCEVSFDGPAPKSAKTGATQTVFLEPGDNEVVIQY